MFTGRRAGRAASIAYEGSGGPFRCGLDLDIKRADLLAMHAAVRRLTAIDEMLGIVPTPYVSIDFVSAPIPRVDHNSLQGAGLKARQQFEPGGLVSLASKILGLIFRIIRAAGRPQPPADRWPASAATGSDAWRAFFVFVLFQADKAGAGLVFGLAFPFRWIQFAADAIELASIQMATKSCVWPLKPRILNRNASRASPQTSTNFFKPSMGPG
jgi:hypothetical protein